jgi:hypothetical protein
MGENCGGVHGLGMVKERYLGGSEMRTASLHETNPAIAGPKTGIPKPHLGKEV